jgi:RNA polymerase sigma-70 factor (ECF subfamily)
LLLKVIQLHKNEKELIRRAIKQDREAQHVLFELHAPKMLSVCRYYIKDIHQAEEAMLNGFFKVFKYLEKFKAQGSFEGWIRRIMVRESISLLRGKKRIEFPAEDISIHEKGSAYTNTELEVEDIQRLIDNLPEGYRIVFVMYAIEGYKHSEIAKLLKISESTSKSQLFKARKVLQQKVKHINKTGDGTN